MVVSNVIIVIQIYAWVPTLSIVMIPMVDFIVLNTLDCQQNPHARWYVNQDKGYVVFNIISLDNNMTCLLHLLLKKSTAQTHEPTVAAASSAGAAEISRTVATAEPTIEYANANCESTGEEPKTPEKRGPVDSVSKMDLLERGQTPERIEFENTDAISDGEPSEEHIIDEHEWSGRNFLPESNNDSESDLSSSDESDTETDSDMFEEANDSPLGVQTLQLASDWIGKQNYSDSDDSDDFYDSSEGLAGIYIV